MPEKNTKFDSRLDQRNHKRKKNNILNILIGIVILLIIIVTVNIVTGDNDEESANTSKTKSEQVEESTENEEKEKESEEVVGSSTESADSSSSTEETTSETEENENTETEGNEDSADSTVTTEPSNDSNVESVVIDSGWQPIGTEQSGEHVSSYTSSSVDWDEKVKALAYGANLDPSNMYVKYLGNGGSPQKSLGTVTSKDGSEIYRISLEWVDGEGWKPTKKEILKALKK